MVPPSGFSDGIRVRYQDARERGCEEGFRRYRRGCRSILQSLERAQQLSLLHRVLQPLSLGREDTAPLCGERTTRSDFGAKVSEMKSSSLLAVPDRTRNP